MYSKHRQKKIQFILTECGHSLIFLFLLLLNSVLEIESGDSTEQGLSSEQETCGSLKSHRLEGIFSNCSHLSI
uniref:Uncharacterized protein n=1 Tax=Anguilla anguilla TaxID=7936 RepID=A0A0E9SHJ1_ANGAN